MKKFTRGTRVFCPHPDYNSHGVVLKGGTDKITVALDKTYMKSVGDGGFVKDGPCVGNMYPHQIAITGHPRAFQPSNEPLHAINGPASKYSVKKYKFHDELGAFSCTIYKNGRAILFVENRGDGGCNSYYRTEDAPRDVEDTFKADIKESVYSYGVSYMLEPEDFWVDWYALKYTVGRKFSDEILEYLAYFPQNSANVVENVVQPTL